MTELASVRITGAKEAIRWMGQVDKELRKEFVREASRIAAPIVDDAKRGYPDVILSGMERAWSDRGRKLFPYKGSTARNGVKVQISSSRKKTSVVTVVQTNPAAALLEFAGKRSASPFAAALNTKMHRPARVMWPAAERNYRQVQNEMEDAIDQVVSKLNRII